MSDVFYRTMRKLGRPLLFGASRRLVLHEERAQLAGGCLLAANHHSFYDALLLVGTTTREIDWLSIVELFQKPWQRWFMRGINCLALDRSRKDPETTRRIVQRLRKGRMVGMFPEGHIRRGDDSVVYGGILDPGIVRLAEIGGVPILPVVILGGGQFSKPKAWLPGAGTVFGVNYGEPIWVKRDVARLKAREEMTQHLAASFVTLFTELTSHPDWRMQFGADFSKKNTSL